MTTFENLRNFFKNQKYNKFIIAADAEPRVSHKKDHETTLSIPSGGVAPALDPVARASNAIYIGRGKTTTDKANEKIEIGENDGKYTLRRIFLDEKEMEGYYYGFSNSTLWPLCHVAFERPDFEKNSYEVFKKVNQKFAKAINEEIKGKTFIWVNDYQLCLVPKLIQRQKDTVIGMFWHIPWPTWEVFRILPQKKEILESLLSCDFIAFHRGYQARNFLDTIGREFEARIDQETNRVYFNKRFTTVKNLPMGIDTEAIESMLEKGKKSPVIQHIAKKVFRIAIKRSINDDYDLLFERYKVILGVDRLDYTKGLRLRLLTLDKFFEKNKKYIGKVTYFGIIAPSRVKIKSYKDLAEEINGLAEEINNKYKSSFPWMKWQPIHLVYKVFERDKIVNFYKKANLSLVTPLDDGMNLVSKEFVVAASFSENPGMIVLSQFAGSAIDLTQALIVNPYNIEEVVEAIKKGLEMSKKEKIDRIKVMKERLDEKNVYEWAEEFVRSATAVGE